MKIHAPKIESVNDEVIVSAHIEFENEYPGIPNTLWFKFPKKYEASLSKNMNGFLVCLLPLAMYLKENIEVQGSISGRLKYNLKEYQRILNFWYSEFSIINIQSEDDIRTTSLKHAGVMCAFSGGVDSFYTLLSHLPQNEPDIGHQITHALFVQGFDRPLSETATFRILEHSYGKLMDSLGIQLIPASTNAREFYVDGPLGMDWELCYDAVLSGLALTLEGLVSRFYFPGDEALPAYFNPHDLNYYTFAVSYLKVPLLSTEDFEMIYHGATTPKIEKIAFISKWQETYERLFVCWKSREGLKNCGTCEKCIRTMTSLDILDSLQTYKTFSTPLTKDLIRKCNFDKDLFEYHEWNIKYALAAGKKDLAHSIRYALFINTCIFWKRKIKTYIFGTLSWKKR